MTVKTNIAAGLKKARKAAGMNVDEVGAVLGKSGKTISAWEVGRGQPDGDELILLCRLLNAQLKDFYGAEFSEYVSGARPEETLTEEELALLGYYRRANQESKNTIMSVAKAMSV